MFIGYHNWKKLIKEDVAVCHSFFIKTLDELFCVCYYVIASRESVDTNMAA
jgi:hypothetical protein